MMILAQEKKLYNSTTELPSTTLMCTTLYPYAKLT